MVTKQKILIVDDDNNIAELISLYLTKECFETKIVNDGEEALREFASFRPDLIILDLTVTAQEDVKPIADATATIAGMFAPCTIAPLQSPMGKKASEGKAPFYTAEA